MTLTYCVSVFPKAGISSLTPAERDELLETVLVNLPGVMFDVWARRAPPRPTPPPPGSPPTTSSSQPTVTQGSPSTAQPGVPSDAANPQPDRPPGRPSPPPDEPLWWCTCTYCRQMPTDIEKLCCGNDRERCTSRTVHMQTLCLEEAHLRLNKELRQEYLATIDPNDPGNDNRELRHAAYRQYILWQYGRLGAGVRRVIPSCVVWAVRSKFFDPFNRYSGFKPNTL